MEGDCDIPSFNTRALVEDPVRQVKMEGVFSLPSLRQHLLILAEGILAMDTVPISCRYSFPHWLFEEKEEFYGDLGAFWSISIGFRGKDNNCNYLVSKLSSWLMCNPKESSLERILANGRQNKE
ncbi:hypothetical protein RHMOL_Rhmol02G0200900 [Rhododendron molle]|uniref:Uncharacterized protein n=1 Tax=Rhododendron molle TaxID=49168 RepID=A0ACC0PTI2_RHOML|nr:hypothetical protein RHMOL_Rhmol02G0200900 [Rhododendron molle]